MPKDSNQSPDLKDLERLVEFELRRSEERRKQFGWTPWALLLALSALGWQLLGQNIPDATWTIVGLVWAALFIGWEYLALLRNILNQSKSAPGMTPRYFEADWILLGSRESILLEGLFEFAACIIVLGWGGLEGVAWFVWLLFTIISSMQVPVALGITFTSTPLTADALQSKLVQAAVIGRWVVWTAGIVVLSLVIWRLAHNGIDRESIKTALLLAVSTRVLIWLSEHHVATPVEVRLIQIRRAIGLKEMDATTAHTWIDEALHGMQPAGLVRRHVGIFEANHKQGIKAQKDTAQLLKLVKQQIQSGQFTPAEETALQVRGELAAAQEAVGRIPQLQKAVLDQLTFAILQHPKVAQQKEKLLAHLKGLSELQVTAQKTLDEGVAEMEDALAQRKTKGDEREQIQR